MSTDMGRAEDRRDVYQQDRESIRYHDKLKWSRFQLVSVVQGALLYLVFSDFGVPLEIVLMLLLIGAGLISFLWKLTAIDQGIIDAHILRVADFEVDFPLAVSRYRGRTIINWSFLLLIATNVVLVVTVFRWLVIVE